MFGLKTFVRVQTFRRGPPRAPAQLLPPCFISYFFLPAWGFQYIAREPHFRSWVSSFPPSPYWYKGHSVEEKKVVKYRCGFGLKDLFCILSYLLSKEQPKLAIKSIFANYKLGLCLDFCCKLFYQTAKRTTNAADSVFMQINYLVFDPEVFANLQIAS